MEKLANSVVLSDFSFGIILITLFVLKACLFLRNKNASWKPADFVYFKYDHIQRSNSRRSLLAKGQQNFLSRLALSVLVLKMIAALSTWIFIDYLR